MDLQAYFDRINYNGSTSPTMDTLQQLMRAHLYAVPFENLSIHMPQPITLTPEWLFDKIVNQHRGGFCFEQNGLFSMVLRQLGFDVTLLEANVYNSQTQAFGTRLGHMTLMVKLDGIRYLVDVGFGSAFTSPLPIDDPGVQVQDVGRFRIEHQGDHVLYYEQSLGAEKMGIGYRFYLEPHQLDDYKAACHYMQTSPDVHFTQKRICSMATPNGRITLSDDKFITTTLTGERTEQPIENEAEFHDVLEQQFGIKVRTAPPQPQRQ